MGRQKTRNEAETFLLTSSVRKKLMKNPGCYVLERFRVRIGEKVWPEPQGYRLRDGCFLWLGFDEWCVSS